MSASLDLDRDLWLRMSLDLERDLWPRKSLELWLRKSLDLDRDLRKSLGLEAEFAGWPMGRLAADSGSPAEERRET